MKINSPNHSVKAIILLIGLLVIACTSKEKKVQTIEAVEIPKVKTTKVSEEALSERSFQIIQDSLRKVLLISKPNEKLKSSVLQELYIRGLIIEQNDEIVFNLPFNLHGFDCGAPDCYTTDLSFKIPSSNPIQFPEKIAVTLYEYGCIDKEIRQNSAFLLQEQSTEYVNYYSLEMRSNLMLKKSGELYYHPHLQANSISIDAIDQLFESNEIENAEIVPYRSNTMIKSDYRDFIKN